MSDPTTPEGRAEIRKRAELAEQSRIYIDELTFHGGEPPILAWQQIAESQADVPALLDALDQRERLSEMSRTRELNADARAEAAEAALDRVRDLLDRHKSQEIYVDDVREALDGAQ